MDTDGSYTCSCDEGFTGDGFTCTGNSFIDIFLWATLHDLFQKNEFQIIPINRNILFL